LFVVIGLNQQTPLVCREQIAIHASNLSASICQLHQQTEINACTILTTCNRIEIYADVNSTDELIKWFKNHHLGVWTELQHYFYCYTHEEALNHALRVASGLDSMLIGEPQILGQLKQAYHLSIELGCMNDSLKTWFEFIFQMTKKIRTQSGICDHPISVASVAVDCIIEHTNNLNEAKVLLIGSGETAKLAAIHLQEKGCKTFLVTSRHIEHAKHLADKLSAIAFPVTELNHYLHQADIIVTATSCPFPFISRQAIQTALTQRQQQPMILIDLAVPRDIEPDVAELSAVTLVNIDHLQAIQANHQAERLRAAKIAETMVIDAIHLYQKKQKTQQAQHLICDYRSHMKNLAQIEVERAHQKLTAGHCQYEVLSELSERLIQKLVHYPTVGMQQAAGENRQDLLELAKYLFNPHRNDTVTS